MSWNLAKKLAEKISDEIGIDKDQNWLIKEILDMLNAYPDLLIFIRQKSGGFLSLREIIELFFELEAKKQNLSQRDYYDHLKCFSIDDVHELSLSDYLLAGIILFLACDFCKHHRYSPGRHYFWHMDYTDAYNQMIKREAGDDEPEPPTTDRSGKGKRKYQFKK